MKESEAEAAPGTEAEAAPGTDAEAVRGIEAKAVQGIDAETDRGIEVETDRGIEAEVTAYPQGTVVAAYLLPIVLFRQTTQKRTWSNCRQRTPTRKTELEHAFVSTRHWLSSLRATSPGLLLQGKLVFHYVLPEITDHSLRAKSTFLE